MQKILVDSLKPGMAFDKPVFIDKDNIFLRANEPMKHSDIVSLKKWNITSLKTEGQTVKDNYIGEEITKDLDPLSAKGELEKLEFEFKRLLLQKDNFINDIFLKNVEKIERIYRDIIYQKSFEIKPLRDIVEEVVYTIIEYPNIFLFLYKYCTKENLYRHVMITSIFAGVIAIALGLSRPAICEVILANLIKDIGMLKLPNMIKGKKHKFTTEEEKKQVQSHVLHSYQIATRDMKLKSALAIVSLQHHENFDGSGYHQKTRGKKISAYARIVAIADSFTALLEEKPYRPANLPYFALREMLTLGATRYDPHYMKIFKERLSMYPIGSLVLTSDDCIGISAQSVQGKFMKPIILLFRDRNGKAVKKPIFLRLENHPNLYVKKVLSPQKSGIDITIELENLFRKSHKPWNK